MTPFDMEEGFRRMREVKPRAEVENTRDRFMDYVGQPLNGASGWIEIEKLGDAEKRKSKAIPFWQEFFRRVDFFLTEPFEPTATVTKESLQSVLRYKESDPMDPEAYRAVKDWFDAI